MSKKISERNIESREQRSQSFIENHHTFSPSKFRKAKVYPTTVEIFTDDKTNLFFQECEKSPIKLEAMVNSKEFADTIFTVGGHVLYAHKYIIEFRCPTLFSVNLKDKPSKKGSYSHYVIDDKICDEATIYSVLYYIYTDTVKFAEMKPMDVVMLLQASVIYELERLTWLCERYLRLVITDDLFYPLLLASSKLNVVKAKNICMDYGKKHYNEIINRKEDVHTLGIELFREFVEFSFFGNVTVEDPEAKSIDSTILSDLEKVYKEKHYCDGLFTFGGDKVEYHKAILLAQSEKLISILKTDKPTLSIPKDLIMSVEAFEAALAFLYYRYTDFSAIHAAEIIPFARYYDIVHLYTECENKVKQGIDIDSVIPIISLCYNKDVEKYVKKDLFAPCMKFITQNFVLIDFSKLKTRSSKIAADIITIVKSQISGGKWKPNLDFTGNATESDTFLSDEDKKEEKSSSIELSSDNLSPENGNKVLKNDSKEELEIKDVSKEQETNEDEQLKSKDEQEISKGKIDEKEVCEDKSSAEEESKKKISKKMKKKAKKEKKKKNK